MNSFTETEPIKRCLELIELKFQRGPGSTWTSYDFEKLSAAIFGETGVMLSVTTLKRVWGKLKYTNVPTTTTLNTLSAFAGYADWRDLIQAIQKKDSTVNVPQDQQIDRVVSKYSKKWLALILLFITVTGSYYLLKGRDTARLNPSAFKFSSIRMVTDGVPNSVVFNYDAAAANGPVFIAQTWDLQRKVAVSKSKHHHSAIYYYPGHFRAQLIAGDQVLKQHELMITSGGWIAMVEREEGTPLYFRKDDVLNSNGIQVDAKLLSQYHVPLQPILPKLNFFNVQDLGAITADHFSFETTLKSEYHLGTAACQRVEVMILCKDDYFSIPLCSKGCVGDLTLYAAGTEIKSKDVDLSKFGCDLDQWQKLKVETRNGIIRFFVNEQEAHFMSFSAKPTQIIGVQYRFEGVGAVKNTRFMKDNKIVDL